MAKRLFFGPRGVWGPARSGDSAADYFAGSRGSEDDDHWRIASNENFLRMRMKLIPNPQFDVHAAASANRDNV